MNSKMQKQNIGNAGEYYVASLLSANNFIATITLGRAEKYDILAVSQKNKTFKFSVKAARKSNVKSFPLSEKDEKGGAKDFYYILVRLNEFKKEPDYWILPSKRMNFILKRSHQIWRRTLSRRGKKHGKSEIRNFFVEISDKKKKYYPTVTDKELKSYYKNIKPLLK